MEAIGLALTLVGILVAVILWYVDQAKRRPIDLEIPIALIGLRSSGKTRLVWTWSKARIIKDEKPGPTRARDVFKLDRTPSHADGRLIRPTYKFYDYGGEQPGLFIDDAVSNYIFAAVLVVDHLAGGEPGSPDHNRIDRTLGYIDGLVRGYLQARKLSSELEIIILFINKGDLYTDGQEALIRSKYAEALQIVKSTGKHVELFFGSAQHGWKTMDALAALDEVLLRPGVLQTIHRRTRQ